MQIKDDLKKKIEEIVTSFGFLVFDLNSSFLGRTRIFRVLIDRSNGGISIEECAQVNCKLNELLEKEFGVNESYTLEVSSPGVNWPIKEKRDFERVILKRIRVFLKLPEAGKSEILGQLREVKLDSLILDLGSESVEIKLDNINWAKEQY